MAFLRFPLTNEVIETFILALDLLVVTFPVESPFYSATTGERWSWYPWGMVGRVRHVMRDLHCPESLC